MTEAQPRRVGPGVAFWTVAAAFLSVMAFSTVPTPLYAIYQRLDGFPTVVITVIFAAYAVGVMVSLYLIGHLSDRVGRRPMILLAILLQLAAAAVFLVWHDVAGLIAARVVSGLGVGALTASATAALTELRMRAHPDGSVGAAATVATVANIGGLALGPLAAGVLAEYVPLPLSTPYVVFLVLLVVAGAAILVVPETVDTTLPRRPYRPQRIAVPQESRAVFAAAGAASFSAFGVFGLFTSLAPTFLAEALGEPSRLLAGVVSFAVFAAGAATQVFLAGLSLRRQVLIGVVLMIAGLAASSAAVLEGLLALFIVGGTVAGAGVGLVFRGSLGVAGSVAEPQRRGEVLAALFLISYAGLIVPVLAVGLSLLAFPLTATLMGFSVLTLLLVVLSGARMARAVAGVPVAAPRDG